MKKKNRSGFVFAFLALAPLLILWVGLVFCFQSGGFSLDKITSKLAYDEAWEISAPPREKIDFLIHEVFPQPFYYLGSGNQCYAFVSQDRKYVIKFFKMQNLQASRTGGYITFFTKWFDRESGIDEELSFERIFTSYKDAFEELNQETGLLFVHLNKSHSLKTKVNLIDQWGKKYSVDLDSTEFVVQLKAVRIFDCLNAMANEGQWEEVKNHVRAFFQMIAARSKKGFADNMISIRNNFGFVDGRAVQFDCGTLTRDSSMRYPLNFRNEVMHMAERMNEWAQSLSPEMSLLIQEEAQAVINESF